MNTARLQMNGIVKQFGGIRALKGVDFSLQPGEIHALLGENGAGKSTLMNILGGVLQADEGDIRLDGQAVRIATPADARRLGISFIHQELNLIPDLTVAENLFLGAEWTNRLGWLDARQMQRKTREIMDLLGVELDPQAPVSGLDSSLKQVIEIGKALLKDSTVIIMDEPTTSLTEKEIDNIFQVMHKLKQNGVSLIFISHKLKEVMNICDKYTVLRDGEVAASGMIGDTDEQRLAQELVGRSVQTQSLYRERVLGETVLEVKGLAAKGLADIHFTLRRREILGFTGLAGAGHSELMETLFGYKAKTAGEIKINGQLVQIQQPLHALAHKLGFVPKNRKENGILKDMSILQNFSLAGLKKFVRNGWILETREREHFRHFQKQLQMKAPQPDLPITSLSGGNQQKVILARWLEADADIIVLDQPTQGVDIGAKSEIYQVIMDLAAEGKSFIVVSTEIPEMLKLCDRIVVMYQGRIAHILDRQHATEGRIMLYATGAQSERIS
ncbi:sugar ABC transporter ATP-binding protein [Brevibacillus fulvus]|uniref:Ribose transport system ATP-binding protein n=1 Tax=Brevibacillus fulvus TaxID=1125967 RepID=A0A938XXR6_9BACL|nr:sugar ABC transporter ATP-binding protein [Brevibacillus fulvus]MBM7588884.1 ribose transport system ATP-binding protein [Brevibacillus fulvus]